MGREVILGPHVELVDPVRRYGHAELLAELASGRVDHGLVIVGFSAGKRPCIRAMRSGPQAEEDFPVMPDDDGDSDLQTRHDATPSTPRPVIAVCDRATMMTTLGWRTGGMEGTYRAEDIDVSAPLGV